MSPGIHEEDECNELALTDVTCNGRHVCQFALDCGYTDPIQVDDSGWMYLSDGVTLNIYTGAFGEE